MVAPDKDFNPITDAEIDPDSPITTGLMTKIRDALEHLEQWLGDGFVAAKDHDHDGTNSKQISLSFAVGSGTSYSVAAPSLSSALWVDIAGFSHNIDGVDDRALYNIVSSLQFDISAFTLTGVGRISSWVDTGTPPNPGGAVTDHAATAIADNVFVTVVTHSSTFGGATLQVRYNRTTDVFDIRVTTSGLGATSDVGMRVLEI